MLFSQGVTIVVQVRWRLGRKASKGRGMGDWARMDCRVRPEVRPGSVDSGLEGYIVELSEPLQTSTTTRTWHPSACAFPARVPRGRGCRARKDLWQ